VIFSSFVVQDSFDVPKTKIPSAPKISGILASGTARIFLVRAIAANPPIHSKALVVKLAVAEKHIVFNDTERIY
jgi:hypothetical protein